MKGTGMLEMKDAGTPETEGTGTLETELVGTLEMDGAGTLELMLVDVDTWSIITARRSSSLSSLLSTSCGREDICQSHTSLFTKQC